MDSSAAIPCASAASAGPRLHRLHVFLLVVALLSWWEAAWRQGAALGAGQHLNLAFAATIMVTARLAASACEALAYVLWWRTRGARLPYVRFLVALVALSLVDRFALSLGGLAERTPALAGWLAPIAGLQLVGRHASALATSFGSFGLLTLARLVVTAWLQAEGLGRRLGGPLLVTVAAWLVTRVALWWTLDLLRGMSPVR